MKVLHLSATDIRGGAARGAFWLHQELRRNGIASSMLVGRKYGDDHHVSALGGAFSRISAKLRDELDPLPLHRYRKTDDSFWTVGWVPRRLVGAVSAYRPDLVHLHWTGGGFLPINALRGMPCPVVWTLRDMWAFTGGCHYSAGCWRYETACGRCPQLRSNKEDDLSRTIWRRKHSAWEGLDLRLVPISSWLASCAKRSSLFGRRHMEVIPNGVDTARFRPIPRAKARAILGLPPDKSYILFGALGALQDRRKGFPQLVQATRQMARECWTTRAELLVFGDVPPDTAPSLSLPARFLGRIHDDEKLAALYAAADVMVAPSLQEAFGKTLIEAMACGTPVVAFDGSGPDDIVVHRKTGYLARSGDAGDLAWGIAWCLEPKRHPALCANARARAETEFDITTIAGRYRNLYQRILEETS